MLTIDNWLVPTITDPLDVMVWLQWDVRSRRTHHSSRPTRVITPNQLWSTLLSCTTLAVRRFFGSSHMLSDDLERATHRRKTEYRDVYHQFCTFALCFVNNTFRFVPSPWTDCSIFTTPYEPIVMEEGFWVVPYRASTFPDPLTWVPSQTTTCRGLTLSRNV